MDSSNALVAAIPNLYQKLVLHCNFYLEKVARLKVERTFYEISSESSGKFILVTFIARFVHSFIRAYVS